MTRYIYVKRNAQVISTANDQQVYLIYPANLCRYHQKRSASLYLSRTNYWSYDDMSVWRKTANTLSPDRDILTNIAPAVSDSKHRTCSMSWGNTLHDLHAFMAYYMKTLKQRDKQSSVKNSSEGKVKVKVYWIQEYNTTYELTS